MSTDLKIENIEGLTAEQANNIQSTANSAEVIIDRDGGVSNEVEKMVKETVFEEISAVIKSGELGDPDLCGNLMILFKDKADEGYGVLNMKFDSQGNYTTAISAPAESPSAQMTADFLKNEDPGMKEYMDEGYRVVFTHNTGPCSP